jgi:hypothetical protein
LSDNEPDSKPDLEEELLSVWQRLSLKQLSWIFVAVVLVITAAFGGLQTAQHVTPVSFGQAYNDGPLRITAHSVSLAEQVIGLAQLSSECRYLILHATIQSTASDSVPFPLQGVLTGAADDCAPHVARDTEMFGMVGIAGRFAATLRGHESIPVPTIEPGFTNDYSVVWVVSQAGLSHHSQIAIRFYRMDRFVSTFLIAHRWSGDPDHYAELQIPNLELS